jgi:hypothetical protein
MPTICKLHQSIQRALGVASTTLADPRTDRLVAWAGLVLSIVQGCG